MGFSLQMLFVRFFMRLRTQHEQRLTLVGGHLPSSRCLYIYSCFCTREEISCCYDTCYVLENFTRFLNEAVYNPMDSCWPNSTDH
eukprot:c44244_g1_i1 orf=164-418(+)